MDAGAEEEGSMTSARRRLAAFAACAAVSLAFTATALADNYAGLGDSYSAGTGTNSYSLNSSCTRGVYAYPYLAFQQRPNTALTFVACGGATTADVINTQVNSLSSATNEVSITIGGNDIGFASLITNCTLANCLTALQNANTNIQTTLPAKLDNAYNAIRAHAPNARVTVLGYPQLMQGRTCGLRAPGISSSEAVATDNTASLLDQTIAGRAAAHGFVYKSAIAQFSGHGVCSSSPWLNGLNLFSDTSGSFHPNRTGHASGYLPLLRQVIG
jgi:hypothetical protein